jgi:carbon-monoxide dehydrogenase small subunit
MKITLTINHKRHDADVEPRTLLADFIRDSAGLTGTKVGCEDGRCGSCLVLLDGKSVKSCSLLAVQADGAEITTIEGIAERGQYSAIQEGLHECHGVQCGFCTPGIVIGLTDLLKKNPAPDEPEIRAALQGNLCRCTGYQNVVRAAQYAIDKTNSPVRMIVDTPKKRMYENQVRHLISANPDGLVDDNYNEHATVASFDFKVTGKDALKAHFRNYMRWVQIKEVLSTDKFVETEAGFSFEATVRTNRGIGRVYDVFVLENDKVSYHFTGMK